MMQSTLQFLPLRSLARQRFGWIGVDIGCRALKMAQLVDSDEGWQIARGRIIRYPDGGTLESTQEHDDWLVDTVRRELSAGGGFRGRQAAFALSLTATELRSVDLPVAGDDEIRDMVGVELVSDARSASEQREFEFWRTDVSADDKRDNMTHLNVLSISTDLANRLAMNLFKAGLCCRILDGIPFTVARAVGLVQPGTGRAPVAALDWGESSALFTVIADGTPCFTRLLRNCGTGRLKEALIKGLHFESAETDQLLAAYGLPGPEAVDSRHAELAHVTTDLGGDVLDLLVDELRRTLLYLKAQIGGPVPKRIWLVGGGANVKNVALYLSERLEFPFAVWGIPQRSADFKIPVPLLASAAALSSLAWHK